MEIEIVREDIKGKYFIVAREDGKITAKKKYSKNFTIKKAKKIYKHNRTFDENLERRKLFTKPYEEYTDTSAKPHKPRGRPFRFIVKGMLKDGRIVTASSRTQEWKNMLEAEQEADKRFFERLAFEINNVYDADEGMKLVSEVKSIEKSIVYYR